MAKNSFIPEKHTTQELSLLSFRNPSSKLHNRLLNTQNTYQTWKTSLGSKESESNTQYVNYADNLLRQGDEEDGIFQPSSIIAQCDELI